jgi:hypothetical protein
MWTFHCGNLNMETGVSDGRSDIRMCVSCSSFAPTCTGVGVQDTVNVISDIPSIVKFSEHAGRGFKIPRYRVFGSRLSIFASSRTIPCFNICFPSFDWNLMFSIHHFSKIFRQLLRDRSSFESNGREFNCQCVGAIRSPEESGRLSPIPADDSGLSFL